MFKEGLHLDSVKWLTRLYPDTVDKKINSWNHESSHKLPINEYWKLVSTFESTQLLYYSFLYLSRTNFKNFITLLENVSKPAMWKFWSWLSSWKQLYNNSEKCQLLIPTFKKIISYYNIEVNIYFNNLFQTTYKINVWNRHFL